MCDGTGRRQDSQIYRVPSKVQKAKDGKRAAGEPGRMAPLRGHPQQLAVALSHLPFCPHWSPGRAPCSALSLSPLWQAHGDAGEMGGKEGGTRSGVKGVKREHETLWAGEGSGEGSQVAAVGSWDKT